LDQAVLISALFFGSLGKGWSFEVLLGEGAQLRIPGDEVGDGARLPR